MGIAFMFPGQGSQYIGMGKDLYYNFANCREIFDMSSEVIGIDMASLCFEYNDNLNDTLYSQVAIVTVSIAMLQLMTDISPDYVLGLSLGEYCALISNLTLDINTALNLVQKRAEFMSKTAKKRPGAMTAMVGKLSKELIKSICMEASHYGICSPANYNTSNQIVISGEIPALEKAEELAKINGISKTIRLNVSGAFHSELMTDAYIEFLAELKKIKLNPMSLPFISNFNADVIYNDNDKLIHSLAGQLINPVLWEDSMHLLYSKGIDTLVEIGPGRTLSSFAKKINNNFKTYSLDKIDLNNIDLLLKDIKGGY